MAVAETAGDFGANHAQAAVCGFAYIFLGNGSPETGPARAGFELGVGVEESGFTADAAEDTLPVGVGIVIREGWLGGRVACDSKSIGRELPFPLGFGLDDAVDRDGRDTLAVIRELDDGYGFGEIGGFGFSVNGLISFREAPSEENTEHNGAGQERTATENGGGEFVFFFEREHSGGVAPFG